jgi:hypothetical protein
VTAYAATLRLARIVTARTLELGSRDLGAAIVHRDGLTLERGAPVLVAHDDGRTVGRVSYLHEIRDDDGAPWIAAHVELDDPPSWLRVGTACSMAWTQPANPDGWIERAEDPRRLRGRARAPHPAAEPDRRGHRRPAHPAAHRPERHRRGTRNPLLIAGFFKPRDVQ